jgi:hypothetical protein
MTDGARGWAQAPLGDVVTLMTGKTPTGLASVAGGTIAFYKVADMLEHWSRRRRKRAHRRACGDSNLCTRSLIPSGR